MRRLVVLAMVLVGMQQVCAQQSRDAAAWGINQLELTTLDSATAAVVASHLDAWRATPDYTEKVHQLDAVLEALPFTEQKAKLGEWQLTELQAKLAKAASDPEQHFYQQAISDVLNHILTTWFVLGELDVCRTWMQLRLECATAYGLTENVADCHTDLGVLAIQVGLLDTALLELNKAVAIYETLDGPTHYANCLVSLGRVYKLKGDYQQAIALNQSALNLRELAQDSVELAHSYGQLADIYSEQGDFENSIRYWMQAIRQYALFGPPKATLLAGSQSKAALVWLALGDTVQAIELNRQALALCEQHGLPFKKIDALVALAEINTSRGNFSEAQKQVETGLGLARDLGHTPSIAQALVVAAKLQLEAGDARAALSTAREAYQLAQALQDLRLRMESAQLLANACPENGLWEQAYNYQREATALRDELVNTENQQLMIRQQVQYDYDKQKALLDLAHQNELAAKQAQEDRQTAFIQLAVGVALVLLLLVAIIANRLALTRKQKKVIEHQSERLRVLDANKTRFFANISHELRTPLTLILGPLESLFGSSENLAPEQRSYLRLIRDNGKRLRTLVEEILDLSKLEEARLTLKPAPVNLHNALTRLVFSFEAVAKRKNVELSLTYKPEPDRCYLLDPDRVEKIIINLLSNALKFTDSGSITVAVRALDTAPAELSEGSYLEVSVRDTGAGISADDLPHIFDRYFQSTQPALPLQGGTGIGLALARELAVLHGGDLSAESTLGRGTTFTLHLPLRETAAPAKALGEELAEAALEVMEPISSTTASKPTRVLVVEDHLQMNAYISQLLEANHEVVSVHNGRKAWEYLQHNEVDLVTSDVMMPDMDGFELLQRIKGNARLSGLPVLLLTAREDRKDRLNALALGVDDYLTKPFVPAELTARVGNLLANRHNRMQLAQEENQAAEASMPSVDEAFIAKLKKLVHANIADSTYKVDQLVPEMGVSRRQLYRDITRITGLAPGRFLREVRLLHARDILEAKTMATVAEVCYAVGFEKPSYFAQIFQERFGRLPSTYL